MGANPKSSIRHGIKAAMRELEKSYEGPLRGLDVAKDFFARLGSEEFAGTPLARGLGLQNALLDEATLGLTGGSNFALPTEIGRAAGNQIGGFLGAAGIEGSPAGAVAAANRLTGISEQVRQSRLGQALTILGGAAGGSVFPSASEFLRVGANKASQAANIQYQGGLAKANAQSAYNAGIGQIAGILGGGAIGALTGGLGLIGGLGGGLTGVLGGFGVGSGLLPGGMSFGGGGGGDFMSSFQGGYAGSQFGSPFGFFNPWNPYGFSQTMNRLGTIF